MKTLLTPAEVAEITQLSVETIQEKCRTGELRATKLAGRWRIREDAVDEWLASCEPEPGVINPIAIPQRAPSKGTFRELVGSDRQRP